MLKTLAKTALAAASILVGAGTANASVNVTIQSNGFGTGPIEVVSENGTSWTKVLPSDMTLPVYLEMGITSGELGSYSIRQNGTSIGYWGEFLDGPSSTQETHTVTGSTSNFIFETQTVLNLCNDKLNVGQGINQQHTFWYMVPLTLRAHFYMTNGDPYPYYEGYGTVPVQVHCKPVLPVSNDVAADQGEFLIKESKLFLTTIYTGQNTGHTLGGCKTLKTTVRFQTSKLGPVTFDLHRFPGGKTTHTVQSEFEPDTGKYYARYHKYETFQNTTSVQYMAQSTSPTGGMTGWKDITIYCGGGLTQNPNPVNPDDIPQGQTLVGDFGFVDYGSPKCARTGKALISFKSPKPDNIHYSLDCKQGSYSGVASTVPHPAGGYASAALVSFDVEKTLDESCTLRTVQPYGPKDHVTKQHLFQCVKRNVETGSNDIQVAPKPQTRNPRVPATLVPDAQDKAKANAVKRRREAAKKKAQAEAKRKREAAAKRTKEAKKKAEAAAKRKREAAAKRKKAAKAAAKRKAAAEALARRRAAAAALAKRKAAAARKRKTSNNSTQMRVMRLR
jgi:hypothetical protein